MPCFPSTLALARGQERRDQSSHCERPLPQQSGSHYADARMRTLETPRLLIRPFTEDDLLDFAAIMHACFPDGPVHPVADRALLAYYALADRVQVRLRQPPYGDRAVILKQTATLIGAVGLVPCLAPFGQLPSRGRIEHARFTPEVGLFWAVAPEHRNRGYASEAATAFVGYAFDELQLEQIVATTEHDNAASIATMRRLGMTIERNPWPTPEWFQVVGTRHAGRA